MAFPSGFRVLLPFVAALSMLFSPAGHADPTREQIQAAKVIVVAPPTNASAFCISETGLFLTSDYAAEGKDEITVVIAPSSPQEKRYKATVVRRLKELKLALLQITPDQPLSALKLSDVSTITEHEEVFVVGIPLRQTLSISDPHPTINVVQGRVLLLEKKSGELSRFAVDANIDQGFAAGPVLDAGGNVLGLVADGISFMGKIFVIPASVLSQAVLRPVVDLICRSLMTRTLAIPWRRSSL